MQHSYLFQNMISNYSISKKAIQHFGACICCRQLDTHHGVVVECTEASELSATTGATDRARFHIAIEDFGGFFGAMHPQKVSAAVALVTTLKGAVAHGAAVLLRLFALSVTRIHMDLERLGVNKCLVAFCAFELHLLFVLFHMVVHSGLVLFSDAARRAYKHSVFVADIDHTIGLG